MLENSIFHILEQVQATEQAFFNFLILGKSPGEHSPLGKYHYTAGLQFNKTGTDQKEHLFNLYLCSKAVESKLVKLETSRTVILPPAVSVVWINRTFAMYVR